MIRNDNPDKGTEIIMDSIQQIQDGTIRNDNPDKGTEIYGIRTYVSKHNHMIRNDNPDKGTEIILDISAFISSS